MKKYTAESALFLNTIIWGGTFVIIKTALYDISSMFFVSLRFLAAAFILLPFLKKIFKKNNKELIYGGLIIGFIYFLEFSTQTIGLNYTSATKSGFITGTFVIFTPVFQYLIIKRKPAKINIIGITLIIFGLIFLSSKGNSFFNVFTELGSNFNVGDFLTLLSAIFLALYLVYLEIISKKFDFMPLVFLQIAVTGICGILFALILSLFGLEEFRFTLNKNVIFAILYTSILATLLTTILQTRFQKEISSTKAGIIFSFEPVFAALIAFFTINEKISNFGVIGCIIIFTGLLVTEIFKSND